MTKCTRAYLERAVALIACFLVTAIGCSDPCLLVVFIEIQRKRNVQGGERHIRDLTICLLCHFLIPGWKASKIPGKVGVGLNAGSAHAHALTRTASSYTDAGSHRRACMAKILFDIHKRIHEHL